MPCPKRDLSNIALWRASAAAGSPPASASPPRRASIPSGKLKLGNGETLLNLITH
ncbi:MAG: hypothetical protein U0521_02740 [Anaerolineae bacterium]